MLNRRHRLITAEEFRAVLRRGRKTPVVGGVIAVLESRPNHPRRFGVVVSKKVGNAVVRNLVKRRVRAACATEVDPHDGLDVVVRADERAPEVSVDTWRSHLLVAFDRVKK